MRTLLLLILSISASNLICQEREIERKWKFEKEIILEHNVKSVAEFTAQGEACSDNIRPNFKYHFNENGDLTEIYKYRHNPYPVLLIKYERNTLGNYLSKKRITLDSLGREIQSTDWIMEFDSNEYVTKEYMLNEKLDTIRVNQMIVDEFGRIIEQKSGPQLPATWKFSYNSNGLLKEIDELVNYKGEYVATKNHIYNYEDGQVLSERKINPKDTSDIYNEIRYHYLHGRIESSNSMIGSKSPTANGGHRRNESYYLSTYSYYDNGLIKSISKFIHELLPKKCVHYEYEYY